MTIRLVFAVLLGVTLGTVPATAQHPQHDQPRQHGQHGRHAPDGATAPAHHDPEGCEREFEAVVADGRGFGMAFAADRHGYPGPLHVLELADRLVLTDAQRARARALMDAMFAESRPKGAALIAAERRLAELFASGRPDEASVRAAVAEVERLRAELRVLHLTTHLKTRDVLTPGQRRLYHDARWGK
jgi:Spy/CpxP family protein refolding chaperone